MNKFICEGTVVKNKINGHVGTVINFNPTFGIAIVSSHNRIWSDSKNNLEVISYKEVE